MLKSSSRIENLKLKIQEISGKINSYNSLKINSLEKSRIKTDIKKLTNYLSSLKQSLAEQEKFADKLTLISNTKNSNRVIKKQFNKKKTLGNKYIETVTDKLEIAWEEVNFLDNQLKIKIGDRKFLKYSCLSSRRSYNSIKIILKKRNLPNLEVYILNGKISKITNINNLNDAIRLLEIQNIWDEIYKDPSLKLKNKLKSIAATLTKAFYNKILTLKERTVYTDFLCSIQDNRYHLVPIFSVFDKSNNKDKDSFLFTALDCNRLMLIWESVEINKATYIFYSTYEEYEFMLQNIFDFISTFTKNQRMKLRSGIYFENSWLQPSKIIYHTNFQSWKSKIV